MERHLYTLLIIVTLFTLNLKAQNDSYSKNSIYFELGGTAGHYSIKYDRIIFKKNLLAITGNIGFSPSLIPFVNGSEKLEFEPRIPMQINMLIGKRQHYFKYGLGFTPYKNSNQNMRYAFFPVLIGYQYRKIDHGLYISFEFMPLYYEEKIDIYPWFGIGLGYSF